MRLNRERAQRLREEKLKAKESDKDESVATNMDELDAFFTQSHSGREERTQDHDDIPNDEELEELQASEQQGQPEEDIPNDEELEEIRAREEEARMLQEKQIRGKCNTLFSVTHAESYFDTEIEEQDEPGLSTNDESGSNQQSTYETNTNLDNTSNEKSDRMEVDNDIQV